MSFKTTPILALILIFIIADSAFAEKLFSSAAISVGWTEARYFNTGLQNKKSFSKKYWPYAAAIAIGSGLFAFDDDLHEFSQKSYLHNHGIDNFSKAVGRFGPGGPYIMSVPLLASYGLIFKSRHSLSTAIELTAGFAVAELITGGAKITAGRQRPGSTADPYDFFSGGHSFWSGHTICAFTFAAIMSKRFPCQNLGFIGINRDAPVIPILTYSFAAVAGLQRLYSNAHWASDVYFAGLAGYAIGSLTVHFSDKIQAGQLRVVPGETSYIIYDLAFDLK